MEYTEAYEYLKRLTGCANRAASSECGWDGRDECDNCEFDYNPDEWEDAIAAAIRALGIVKGETVVLKQIVWGEDE